MEQEKSESSAAANKKELEVDNDDDDSQWSDMATDEEEDEVAPVAVTTAASTGSSRVEGEEHGSGEEEDRLQIDLGHLRRKKGTTSQGKKPNRPENVDVPDYVRELDTKEFEQSMELGAKRIKWNRGQVKTFIRRVIECPDLINLVLQQSGDLPESPNKIEPKFTRKKARNIKEDGGKLPWVLEKLEQKTPAKRSSSAEVPIVSAELPEEEEEDDHEYDPSKDLEATHSDDDDSVATSDAGTPSGANFGSPNSSMSLSTPRIVTAEDDLFKHPSDSARRKLSLGSTSAASNHPAKVSGVARSLNFDDPMIADYPQQQQQQRTTRSKSSLKDVAIEELETRFVPPDITPDMYDQEVDMDFAVFLRETFYQPINSQPGSMREDTDQDPDYNFQENEDFTDMQDDFRFDKSTKIPNKEVDYLINDVITEYDLLEEVVRDPPPELGRVRKRRQQEEANQKLLDSYYDQMVQPALQQDNSSLVLSHNQMLTISHQMRQHIQLLTQMTLLTSCQPMLALLNNECKQMTSEIVAETFNKEVSSFSQDNLLPSMMFIDQWEKSKLSPCIVNSYKGGGGKERNKYELSDRLIDRMGNETCFPYPSLLPQAAINLDDKSTISSWMDSEDQLIALGLEHYSINKKNALLETTKSIAEHLVVTKTPQQIRKRIRNQQRRKAEDESNPITHFFRHKVAPRLRIDYQNFLPILPIDVKLRCAAPQVLPQVWRFFFKLPGSLSEKPKRKKNGKSTTVEGATAMIPEQPVANLEYLFQYSPSKQCMLLTECKDMPILGSKSLPLPPPQLLPEAKSEPVMDSTNKSKGLLKKTRVSPIKTKKSRRAKAKAMEPSSSKLKREEVMEEEEACNADPYDNLVQDETSTRITILDHALEESGIAAERPMLLSSMPVLLLQSPTKAKMSPPDHKRPVRKNSRQKAEAKETLQLLEDETEEEEQARKVKEATEIIKFAEAELGQEKYDRFLQVLLDNEEDGIKSFVELHQLCHGFVEIQEMLLDLLAPEDSIRLGAEIYKQFCARDQQKRFFRLLQKCYKNNQPELDCILGEISGAIVHPELCKEELKLLADRLFGRKNQHLYEAFLGLIPQAPEPESILPDSELVELGDANVAADDDTSSLTDISTAEQIDWIPSAEGLEFGGENCKCRCHVKVGIAEEGSHCLHCSLVFRRGKVYIREGKILIPACIEYPGNKVLANVSDKSKSKRSSQKKRMIANAKEGEINSETASLMKDPLI